MARVVQILADGRPGGGTTVVLNLSRQLAAQGTDIFIVTQRNSYLAAEASVAGLTVIELDFSSRIRTPLLAAQISSLLHQLDPSIVHAHGARAGLPVSLIPRRGARRFVYTVHGFHFLHKPPVLYRLARSAEAFCIARADCTVFVSDADFAISKGSHLLRRSRAQRVIKNAVTVDPSSMAGPKVYDIGFLGRLHSQKNPLLLIDILKAMRPLRPSLCVIGGGALETELRSRIIREGVDGQVTLCGECGRATALKILSSCRTLVFPSRWEGHPLALIEAMHLALPVVASDIPGNDEIVVEGETGYLVSKHDAGAYAHHLKRLLGDPVLRSSMATRAQRLATEDYSIGRMLGDHLDLYAGAVAAPQRASQGATA
jgi:glycosyltransferase involved in cell wall biosynthesis